MKYISFSAVLLVLAVAAILPTNSQVISSVLEPQVVPQGHGCFWSGTSPFCFGKCGKFYHTVATDRRGNGKKCPLPRTTKKSIHLVSILEAVYSMEKKIAQVVVVGSFMSDVVTYVDRLPNAGETITGNQLVLCCGGKGANQCVSAARLGARTSMIGKLGKDSFGDEHLQTMTAEGVDTTHITVTDEALTGVGQLTVLPNGQNRVITVSGANAYLTVNDISTARTTISTAKVLLCEIQVEKDTAIAALQTANDLGVLTILNAAPACPNLDPAFFMLSDIFCVNETEAEVTTGIQVRSLDEAAAAAKCLLEKGCKNHVLITLGAQGALLLSRGDAEKPVHIKAPAVSAIDTTGAGDCFLGALAFFLATRPELVLHKAIEYACIVASVSVQRNGTQPSFPHWNELPNELFRSD